MTTTFNNKNVKLPRWAKLIRPRENNICSRELQDSPDDDEQIEEEEIFVRKRCYHILSKQMKQSMQGALDDCLVSSLSTLQDYLDGAAPPTPSSGAGLSTKCNNDKQQQPLRKKQKRSSSPPSEAGNTNESSSSSLPPPSQFFLEGLDTKLFDREQESSVSHDPLLLPVIMVEGPTFGTDRRAQMERLANNLQKDRPGSAVVSVHLSSSSSSSNTITSGNNINNKGMKELVRQCHCLSPVLSSGPLYRRIVKRKKKRACSFSDLLLVWAQHVTDFNEIVLFLNADECFYGEELQDFLHLLATKRAEQGIPLVVVMMGPPAGCRPIELKSTLQGYAGLMIRSITLPSCEVILHCFWKRLWIQGEFPILFPPNVLKTIERSFRYHNQSCHRILFKLQQVLAYRFVRKGSFLPVAHHPAIMNDIWQRLAWFVASEDARYQLMDGHHQPSSAAEVTSTQIYKALETIYSQNQNAHVSLQLMSPLHSNQDSASLIFQPDFSNLFRKRSRRDLLEALVKLRATMGKREDDHNHEAYKLFTKYVTCESLESAGQLANNQAKRLFADQQRFINELIILVGSCRDGDDLSEIEVLLNEVLAVWTRSNADHENAITKRINRKQKCEELPSSQSHEHSIVDPASEERWGMALDFLASEPRKQTVKALIGVPEPWECANEALKRGNPDRKHPPLAHISGVMYRLVHDRVAVTQEDWFEEFWQTAVLDVGATCPREESFTLFSLGLRYLKQCGLIVEKLRVGSRSDIIYERAKLVWCASYE